jgi:hypothetical protein
MSKDYITGTVMALWKASILLHLDFWGSNNEAVGKDSNMYEFMIGQGVPEDQATDFVSGMPTYWGDQPIVAAPAYIGIVVFFLAIIALFIDKRRLNMYFLPVRL